MLSRQARSLAYLHRHQGRRLQSTSKLTLSAVSTQLSNPSLLPDVDKALPYFEVRDPADPDSVISHVAAMGEDEARDCIQRSAEALPSWRDETTASYRSKILLDWSRLIEENADDIAKIMTLESGKPLQESKGEVAYGRSFLDYYAAEAIRPTGAGGGFIVPTPFTQGSTGKPRGQAMALNQAVGVTALITPWNFPLAMITRKVGPALAVGCTSVVKPAQLTPLTAIAVHTLALQAGIPPDVFQLVTANNETTPEVGKEFTTNPLVSKVSFTGSTAVGKLLMKQSAGTMKRLSLELGGNAPFIVFEDANIDQAVDAAMASKYRNAGQTCVCADRFLIHADVHDEFVEKLVSQVKQLKIGPGMDPSTTMGPLITSGAVQAVHAKVQEAIAEGATCVVGGKPLDAIGQHFYAPTILTNVVPTSRIFEEETFGPVTAIHKFESEEEALSIANDSRVGLASYFCTTDMSRAFRFSQQIESGMVGVNEGIISTASCPFGGVKESGLGREGSPLGVMEYLETKYVFMNF